ncbi:MAG: hypothetical protein ACD_12C00260G0001, partial [uncultured bacterium]
MSNMSYMSYLSYMHITFKILFQSSGRDKHRFWKTLSIPVLLLPKRSGA